MLFKKYYVMILLLRGIDLNSCTGILFKTTQGACGYARTLEFGDDIASQSLFIPRNYRYTAPAFSNKDGLSWASRYGVVGASAYSSTYFVDGVNEKGLAGGLFYFPGFAEYEDVTPAHYSKSLPMWALLTWILTTCATVQEVKAAVPTVHVSKALFPGNPEIIPVHLVVHDAQGASAVIEYVQGGLRVYDNPLGVVTNAPGFDWHMTNVRNYINLTPVNAAAKSINGVSFAQLGQGSGMLGLPGDFTPPSRFVRAVAFSQAAIPVARPQEAVHQAFHILNNFDIPKGATLTREGHMEYTQWTSAIDLQNRVFYWRTYENFQPQKIELSKMNLNSTKAQTFSMNG